MAGKYVRQKTSQKSRNPVRVGHGSTTLRRGLASLRRDQWVMVNGSGAYLPRALLPFPSVTVLHITAGAEVLRSLLNARQRETRAMVEARVKRAIAFQTPPDCRLLEIHNDTSLEAAGINLMQSLNRLKKWPSTAWVGGPALLCGQRSCQA